MKRKRPSDSIDLDETVNVAGDEEDNVLTQFYAQRAKLAKSWELSLTGLSK